MRIGSLAITRQRKVKKTIAEQVGAHLVTQDVRDIIARMARSEVKNYLAELAEAAGMPFASPEEFLRRPALTYHGDDCPGHTTGKPGESCLDHIVHCQRPNCTDAEHPVCGIKCDGRP